MKYFLKKNVCLKPFTSFKIGGKAKYFAIVKTINQLKLILKDFKQEIPIFILGNGSNILFDDKGFNGLIIQNKINFYNLKKKYISVGSGILLPILNKKFIEKNITGLEFANLIPATLGGAIYMNAGANNNNISDIIKNVFFMDFNGQEYTFNKTDLTFDYRYSSFQKKRES